MWNLINHLNQKQFTEQIVNYNLEIILYEQVLLLV